MSEPHYNGQPQSGRLDRIEAILSTVATLQAANTQAIAQLTDDVADLAENTNRVLARSAVLDDVVLGLQENVDVLQNTFLQHQQNFDQHLQHFEQHQRNTEENQRSINAALDRLESILVQIIRRFE